MSGAGPAGLLSSGGPGPLPTRPLLPTPPHLQPRVQAERQRQQLSAQPWPGLGGLLLGAAVFVALALGTGSTATSLLVLGPLATFALPAVAIILHVGIGLRWPFARPARPRPG